MAVLAMTCAAEARSLPDLVISEVRLAGTGTCTGRGPRIAGTVVVKNLGNARGFIFTTRDMVAVSVRGHKRLSTGVKFVNALRPGETQEIDVRLGDGVALRGVSKVTIDVRIDPQNVFEEASEANNQTSVEVVLACDGRRDQSRPR